MPGLRFTIPTAFTDVTIPVVQDDFLFPSGSGPLLLIDLANDQSGTVPSTIVNYAANKAAPVLGVAASVLNCTFAKRGTWTDNTDGKFERTAKGGLHGIVSQVNNSTVGNGGAITVQLAILTYMRLNPTHSFYFSHWGRITRTGIVGANWSQVAFGQSPGTYTYLDYISDVRPNVPSPTGHDIGTLNTVGTFLRTYAGGANAWENSTVPVNDTGTVGEFWWGATGFMNGFSGLTNKCPSWVLYRFYIEDLTLSGRSYATVRALDLAAYTTQVLTPGGIYYGDTFTAASTLP